VAIVTGSGRGIGRATALTLAREGAAVSLAARIAAEIEAYGQSNPLFGPLTRAEVSPPPDPSPE
jgi:NAD(P)-dependent dehydrogenase (short-subunit alcohol dehydrogenase family)